MDRSDRSRRHGIETDQRAGRHHDLTAIFPCKLDQIVVLEQRADAEHNGTFSASDHRRHDRSDELARRAFDHDVSGIGERLDWQHRRDGLKLGEPRAVFLGILDRHSG